MHEFKIEKDILKGIEQAEKIVTKKCDWKDKREISIMNQEKNKEDRKAVLDKIVLTRVCPSCKNRIYIDSSWVVKNGIAICRSCFHSRGNKDEEGVISGGFLGEPIIRFEYDGWKIKSLRERAGVGANSFADKMGWSKKYQYEIEREGVHSLSLETVEKLIKVFESFDVIITDSS